MKITVNELRCLVEYIYGKHSDEYEENRWYLRRINNTLSDIKEKMEESDVELATQPPVTELDDLPF
ncbi:MAG: hypothetical protein ACI4D4_07390 [Lachnospira sp.]